MGKNNNAKYFAIGALGVMAGAAAVGYAYYKKQKSQTLFKESEIMAREEFGTYDDVPLGEEMPNYDDVNNDGIYENMTDENMSEYSVDDCTFEGEVEEVEDMVDHEIHDEYLEGDNTTFAKPTDL